MSLLALVLVLLVLSIPCAGWLVAAAHGRAAASGQRAAVEEGEAVAEDAAPVPVLPYVDAVEEAQLAGGPCDAYADPVDGVPFARGEQVVSCRCGAGYRVESLEWLGANLCGRCVECGFVLEAYPDGAV